MPIAYIGLGANMAGPAGSPEATLAAGAERLESLGRVAARSSLYSTEPVGFAEQPRFLNAVVALETHLAPRVLLAALLDLELEFGRDRAQGFANGPRTLDLDILLFGDMVLREHDLDIPHPRMAERAFVLVPLDEIAPDLREPRSGCTVGELLDKLVSDPEGPAHAVVKMESNLWRSSGTGRANADSCGAVVDPDHG
jgi:2-amino-4-hydroxy-6-hydroxymethyldihydropteridine diphosphokinase